MSSRRALPKAEAHVFVPKAQSHTPNAGKPGSLPALPPLAQLASDTAAQSQLVENLQAYIGSELHACRKALLAEQDAFMTNFKKTLEAWLEANNSRHNELTTHLGDLEKDVRSLEGNMKEMDQRVSKAAFQALTKHSEQQVFETQVISFFEMFEESLRALNQAASSGELQYANIWRAKTAEQQNAVESILEGTASGHAASTPQIASRCKRMSMLTKDRQLSTPAPQSREARQGNVSSKNSLPWPGSGAVSPLPDTSFRVEALEAALASMQQDEQERIRRLQLKIRELHKA